MERLDTSLITPVWQPASVAQPTNPSSLTLALVGVGTLAVFGARRLLRAQRPATGRRAAPTAESAQDRRAA